GAPPPARCPGPRCASSRRGSPSRPAPCCCGGPEAGSMSDVPRLLPETGDHDTGGFFAAAAREELAVCACAACGAVLHLPRAWCDRCGHWGTVWRTVAGRGRLYSWTTVEHQVHRAFPVPYTIVLVEPDDAPEARLVGYLPGRPDP